jgi:hypothetical protein
MVFAGFLVTASAAAAATSTMLTITYWPHGRERAATMWTLGCDPTAGTHPKPALSCTTLRAHASELGPATKACTLMSPRYAALARIVGTWHGKHVDRMYRVGCPGWNDLRPVLTGR